MLERLKSVYNRFGYLLFWLTSSILITLVMFQLHATFIALAIVVINNPSLRPTGWNSGTLYGISRALWLILGILWLGWVTFTEGYLGENTLLLPRRGLRLFVIIGSTYLFSYLVLLLLR